MPYELSDDQVKMLEDLLNQEITVSGICSTMDSETAMVEFCHPFPTYTGILRQLRYAPENELDSVVMDVKKVGSSDFVYDGFEVSMDTTPNDWTWDIERTIRYQGKGVLEIPPVKKSCDSSIYETKRNHSDPDDWLTNPNISIPRDLDYEEDYDKTHWLNN